MSLLAAKKCNLTTDMTLIICIISPSAGVIAAQGGYMRCNACIVIESETSRFRSVPSTQTSEALLISVITLLVLFICLACLMPLFSPPLIISSLSFLHPISLYLPLSSDDPSITSTYPFEVQRIWKSYNCNTDGLKHPTSFIQQPTTLLSDPFDNHLYHYPRPINIVPVSLVSL